MVLLFFILSSTVLQYQHVLIVQDYTTLVCVCVCVCVCVRRMSFLQKASGAGIKEGAAEMTYAPAGCALETYNYVLVPL